MTTDTTHHTDQVSPVSVQRSAVQVLAGLIDQHPGLPNAYVIIHRPGNGQPSDLHLALETPTGFEQWRTALGITPDDADLHPYAGNSWITAKTVREGIDVSISVHCIILTAEQISAPRDTKGVAA